jgi:predicted transcriptional regulator
VTTLERPDLYVLARFLDKMYDNHLPLKKTNLQMRVGLNYPRFMEYLEWLISHGLIQQTVDDEGTEVYSLSSQGVDAHRRLVAWIRETMKGMRI